MNNIEFKLISRDGSASSVNVNYNNLLAIGYAGRDMEKTMEHIKELEEELGVPAPKKIPTIFQCSNVCLTKDQEIQVVGEKTCGEAEYVIILTDGKILIGIGSDHTDRELESTSVPKSKQVCPKPISQDVWDFEDIKDHWDEIKILSYQTVNGKEILYQEGKLSDILPVKKILDEIEERADVTDESVIFSGTVPVIAGFEYGDKFRCEMRDDKLNRKIDLTYNIRVISEEER